MAPLDDAEVGRQALEDPPVVKQLKEIDDKYLELEKEYEKEVQQLMLEYTKRQQPLLEERKKILASEEEETGPATGTPALEGFWLTAMQNHPAFEEAIQEWDEPVLQFLQDIERHVDEEDQHKGFKLIFRFRENPYFTNEVLEKEYKMEIVNPYNGEIEVKEVISSSVQWKAGKDITVEKVAKKVKGGGAKKSKQKKEKEEPRPSFFRDFFRNLKPGMELPEDAREHAESLADEDDEDDEEDDDALVEYLMDWDHEIGEALRDYVIPFAVRWYTGEAAPEEDEDDDDEDSEEDDLEDDIESDDNSPPRGRAGRPKAHSKKKGDVSSKP